MTGTEDFSMTELRKGLGLRQLEMARRMGLSLRQYQELEGEVRRVRPRHVRLAESVALDVAIEKQDLSLAPDDIRKKVVKLAVMMLQQNLEQRSLEIATSILEQYWE